MRSERAVFRLTFFARVSRFASLVLATLVLFLLSGCHIERIVLEEPVRDRFIEVKSEDHVIVHLDEKAESGYRWTAKCADPLVDLQIEHDPDDAEAIVFLHVHRGFIGPAVVYMRYKCGWSGDCARRVKLQLHRRATDVAVWK